MAGPPANEVTPPTVAIPDSAMSAGSNPVTFSLQSTRRLMVEAPVGFGCTEVMRGTGAVLSMRMPAGSEASFAPPTRSCTLPAGRLASSVCRSDGSATSKAYAGSNTLMRLLPYSATYISPEEAFITTPVGWLRERSISATCCSVESKTATRCLPASATYMLPEASASTAYGKVTGSEMVATYVREESNIWTFPLAESGTYMLPEASTSTPLGTPNEFSMSAMRIRSGPYTRMRSLSLSDTYMFPVESSTATPFGRRRESVMLSMLFREGPNTSTRLPNVSATYMLPEEPSTATSIEPPNRPSMCATCSRPGSKIATRLLPPSPTYILPEESRSAPIGRVSWPSPEPGRRSFRCGAISDACSVRYRMWR